MSKKKRIRSIWEEFKTFINKGNAMALAVGTIIGGAFSGITKSVTNDLIMPLVNIFMGDADFSQWKIALPYAPWVTPDQVAKVDEAGNAVLDAAGNPVMEDVVNYLTYGNFVSAVINFLIMAVVVFFIVKFVNRLTEAASRKEREAAEAEAAAKAAAEAEAAAKAAEEAAKNPPAPTTEELLTQIRDLLAKK